MHPFTLSGTVIHGQQLGRRLGYPTANLLPSPTEAVPPCGVYAATATLADGSRHLAMVNIGYRPTVTEERQLTIEAHLDHFSGDLYDQPLHLLITHRIRDERRMASLDALRAQLALDLHAVRQTLTP